MSLRFFTDRMREQALKLKLAGTITFFFVGPSVFAMLFTCFAIGLKHRGALALIVFIAVSIPVAAVTAWLIAAYFVSPLYPLRDSVRRFSEGYLDQRVDIDHKDEIGEIGLAFNRMAESLGDMVGELREDTIELTVLYETGASLSHTVRAAELKPLVTDVLQHSLDPAMTILALFDDKSFIYRQKGFMVLNEENVTETMSALAEVSRVDLKPAHFGDSSRFPSLPPFGEVIVVPIVITDRVVGALAVFGQQGDKFMERHVRFIETVANQTSIALHRADLYEELEELAIRDDLTGLYNFRYMHSRVDQELAAARSKGAPLSLIILDLDFFKDVNDTHGHMAGDQILRQIADVMTLAVRSEDVVARYGGEEFVVILPDADTASATIIAKRIRAAVASRKFDLVEGNVAKAGSVTVSLGISTYPVDGENKEELIRKADLALYEAKRSGRNAVASASSEG